MRTLAIAAAMLLLAGCGGVIDRDPHGLDEPGWGSTIPKPHGCDPRTSPLCEGRIG